MAGSLILAAVAGVTARWLRHPGIPHELMLPFSPLASPPPERSSGSPVKRAVSFALPPWFGDATRPPDRIAGKVVGRRGVTRVRLAIDVPDPGIWFGRDVVADPDGSFDFGLMRAGTYLLVASDGVAMSHVTPRDTLHLPGEWIELAMQPCQKIVGLVGVMPAERAPDRAASPAVGVAIELAGRVVGVTDARGRYEICARSAAELQARGAGYDAPWYDRRSVNERYHDVLSPEYVSSGTVIDVDGSPARGVGVQPVWREFSDASPFWECVDSSVVVTTDAAGHFTYGGHPAICGVRVFHGASVYEATYPAKEPEWPLGSDAIVPLPWLHGEDLFVRLARSGRDDLKRLQARRTDWEGDAPSVLRGPTCEGPPAPADAAEEVKPRGAGRR